MRVICLGGGPAGLYFAILFKKANPSFEISVLERNRPDDALGWGSVFSDASLANFLAADPESHAEILANFHHWDDIDIFFKGEKISSSGHGFSGIGRRKLQDILQKRAQALGVKLVFATAIRDPEAYADHDLIVAADGANSVTRQSHAEIFRPDVVVGKCRYIWLGSHRRLDAFTFAFEKTEWGWFTLHAYRFAADTSAFIVEAREETWAAAGLDQADLASSIAFCEKLFAKVLDGQRLFSNAAQLQSSVWQKFNRIQCRRWHHENIVLIGDAAHTAHFSIGSGTKLAMEDAISLAGCLARTPEVGLALALYQDEREAEALKLLSASRNRMEWFENVARYAHFEPLQFSYSLLTGSQRIGHENLRARDPAYVERIEHWLAAKSGLPGLLPKGALPPMFTPFSIRGLKLKNRVMVSPMAMYSCQDGLAGDFLLAHLGARALGGAALVMTEMTAVLPAGRITPGCAGLWNEVQEKAWERIVCFVHENSSAKIGLQLGHSGPKGSTRPGWEGTDEPLEEGNWPLLAASAIPYGPNNQVPEAMSRSDMTKVREAFVAAAKRGVAAGFDLLEFHCAHGYLMSSFICPLTNRREDEYGGGLPNRMRFPLEVFKAMRAACPDDLPIAVRISAHDWAPGGNTPDDAVIIAQLFKEAGADLIDVSSGQTTREARPLYGRMYQTPFSDRIRNEAGINTIAVGSIFEADQVNSIIMAGRADLCAIGRAHLADPAWTLHAAASQGFNDIDWPKQYLAAKKTRKNMQQTLSIT